MKTDRELLELAAKAAGINLHIWGTEGSENFADMDAKPYGCLWNPLTDDGDALRLVVVLGLTVQVDPEDKEISSHPTMYESRNPIGAVEYIGADPYAGTRRAIVRAAAEIGGAA